MKVASFLPSFWDVFLLMSLPLTVTFRPNEQTHKVFSICATSQPFPAPNLMLFVVALKRSSGLWARWWVYRSWPITIHQCPPCGEIAMSHKNEHLAATEEVFLDAFPLWCTQIHTCFQPFPAPAPLWSSVGWGSDTGNDACRNLLGRIFGPFSALQSLDLNHFEGDKSIVRLAKYTSTSFFTNDTHFTYTNHSDTWVLNLCNHPKSSHMPITKHHCCFPTRESLRGDRAWFPGVC